MHTYELYATAASVITKSEKVQYAVFLHVAGPDAQKVAQSLNLDLTDRQNHAIDRGFYANASLKRNWRTWWALKNDIQAVEAQLEVLHATATGITSHLCPPPVKYFQ